jgi:hypothetical protein
MTHQEVQYQFSVFVMMLIGLTILITLVLKKVCNEVILNLTDFKKDFTKHKLFFENYAKDNGFDPFFPENWYFQNTKNILAIKVLSNTTQHSTQHSTATTQTNTNTNTAHYSHTLHT